MKIGIYPGSFDPFHIGHLNIYWKAKKIFDKVYIILGDNPNKSVSEVKIPAFILTVKHGGILTDCYTKINTLNDTSTNDITIIRGFRNLNDITYQQEQDYWLKSIKPDLQSIYIGCDEQFKYISSTAIKELKRLDQDYKHLIIGQ